MAITYDFMVEDNLLSVTAAGFDESLEEVQRYGLAIIQEALRHNITMILCDETRLEYRLGTFDTFQSADFIATQAPRLARIALICDPRFTQDAKFWETVVVNRGLTVRVFKEVEMAKNWLRKSA